ncbi:MAG: transglycosylase SLT domain-containing protein [Bacteroides sp.]|jgi:peptidoglycan-binding lysM
MGCFGILNAGCGRHANLGRSGGFLCLLLLSVLLLGYGVVLGAERGTPTRKSEGRVYVDIERSLVGLSMLAPLWRTDSSVRSLITIEPDLELEYRLAELNSNSPIPLSYHPRVRRYIEVFALERRAQVAKMLSLSQYFFPLFREWLDAYRLPLELVYLSVVESGLNPLAVSHSGAVGLWQFKLGSAEMFDLRVDSFVDERMDPTKSTRAACAYLQYLYRMFDDWLLALSAYNVGPGAVLRAIERAGGERDFWRLIPYLPEAAQNYVPAFIAALYVFHYADRYAISPDTPLVKFAEADTVHVAQAVSFEPLSHWTGVSVQLLHFLNPQFRLGYIPTPGPEGVPLVLPTDATKEFTRHRARIYAQSYKPKETPFPREVRRNIRVKHVVQPGEFLHKIAIFYGCTPADVQGWNKGIAPSLQAGDTLVLWVDPDRWAAIELEREKKN